MPYADYQTHLAAHRAYAKTPEGKAARLRANAAYRQRNALKVAAHNAVNKAVLRGKIEPWPACAAPTCTSDEKPEAHHPDYGAPLAVTWLCDSCHKEAHRLTKQLRIFSSKN